MSIRIRGRQNLAKTKLIRIEEFDTEKMVAPMATVSVYPRGKRTARKVSTSDSAPPPTSNPDQKNPHVGEVEDGISPRESNLLADYQRLQAEAQELRDKLRAILAESSHQTCSATGTVYGNPSVRGDPELRRRIGSANGTLHHTARQPEPRQRPRRRKPDLRIDSDRQYRASWCRKIPNDELANELLCRRR